ncbi:MAG TPA: YkgJ family cysteine cluster protein, partial [Terriglobales bacterium]|nr:YkgJ family cysteine cluster protein [Terriglobales bacterium]
MPRPLTLADGVVFTCQSCGDCCRGAWLIGVDDAAHARLKDVDWAALDPTLGGGEKFRRLPLPLASGEAVTFARGTSGACVFLTDDSRCGIHRHRGYADKPQVCREFPYQFVETPDGVTAGLSFACSAVLHHRGEPLDAQAPAVRDVLSSSARVSRVPDPIVLYSGVDIGWADYRAIENGLLTLLGDERLAVPHALLSGSLLVALAVSLARLEQRRTAGAAGGQTLASGLAELARQDYRPLVDVAVTVRAPARGSLAHLAPLYTWLEASRRPSSRAGLVWALYRNYLRLRRGRGLLPDLVGDGGEIQIAAVDAVRFALDDPDVVALLRRYWRHVVARKTLTPMHGVFRGYHTMLVLYAFARWVAKLLAHREGRTATTLADVQAAVRLVEQRFVLHAQFARLFELSPVFTLFADRQYRDSALVRRAVLEPEVG